MSARKKDRSSWRGIAFLIGGIAVLAAAGYWLRSSLLPRADAQVPIPASRPTAAEAPPNPAPQVPSDYGNRVVAYIHDTEPISREELGDYLIERHADKLELLIIKRIIDDACRFYHVEVSGTEIDAALTEQLQGFGFDQKTFVNTLLARYHKNLNEWKEDIIRSRLQMTKLCRSRLQISEDDLHKAFESAHGEKIECKIILWPKGEQGKSEALAEHPQLRDNAEVFDRTAKNQKVKPQLAATAGKVPPFGRHVMNDDNFDRIVFALKENEVSEVFEMVDGWVVIKCLRRLPPNPSVRYEAVRDQLMKEVMEKKIVVEMQSAFDTLKRQANPQKYLRAKKKVEEKDGLPPCDPSQQSRQIVAVYNGQTPITREDFGEFLIARYGAEQVEFLVNRRIIAKECQARKVSVTPEEIEAGVAADLKKLGSVNLSVFEKELLQVHGMNIYQWREDVVRPRLLMTKLWSDRVKVADAELQSAFASEYGEKLEGRMILWPNDQARYAMMQYARIRDDPDAYDEMCKHQPSSTLAAKGGRIGPFGRGALGNKDLEDEAFKLHKDEMTTLLETPEGHVVFKLDKRHPANTTIKLDAVRNELMRKVFERKVQLQMQTAFKDLRDKARPHVMIRDERKPVDLVGSTKNLLANPDGTSIGIPPPHSP